MQVSGLDYVGMEIQAFRKSSPDVLGSGWFNRIYSMAIAQAYLNNRDRPRSGSFLGRSLI